MTTCGKREDAFERFPTSIEEEASDAFVKRLHGEWTTKDQAAFEARLETDPAYADAYRRVEESWASLDIHAETSELMAYREEALAYARRAKARRWLKSSRYTRTRWRIAASFTVAALAIATALQLSPYGLKPGQYRTGIGEQRIVELEDRSRIALDAATSLRVRFSNDARLVELQEGQAQFWVATDLKRPFKVQAGRQTIVALGTVFTVEYVDRRVHVAMIEGRVAVVPQQVPVPQVQAPRTADAALGRELPSGADSEGSEQPIEKVNGAADGIELSAGEEVRISQDGQATIIPNADLEAVTAWRSGKVIFRTEPLGEAVRRLNRYSRLQIEIEDAALAARHISGVFEAGDTQGFVAAIQRYYPVAADYTDADTIRLRMTL